MANNLNFDGMNAMMAKMLSECETQLGSVAKYIFELKQELVNLRAEVKLLKAKIDQLEGNK